MKDTEIEIKVKVENSKPLLVFLKKNAEFLFEQQQIDDYYSPAHRDFLAIKPIKEWLRLRRSDNKFSLNYKSWYFNDQNRASHCDEYETQVEDIKAMQKILQVLDFKPLVTVDKTRKSWLYKNYEISVDAVKGLGDFIEIEYRGKEAKVDIKKITNEMMVFLEKLGVGKVERDFRGYPYGLLKKQGKTKT